jgi:8-oxo-dGTP pyrophosphatase MutT (NUDIX family)
METTCGLFIISANKLLAVHATGASQTYWSIPKGLVDNADDSHLETAIRECYEETGLDIDMEYGWFIDMGITKYLKRNKLLHGYFFISRKDLTTEVLHCQSMVTPKYGKSFPEVNDYKWIEPTEDGIKILHETQQRLFVANKHLLNIL